MYCTAFSFARHEHPEITEGRKRTSQYDGVHWNDERITRLPGRVQLGILRERQRRESGQ